MYFESLTFDLDQCEVGGCRKQTDDDQSHESVGNELVCCFTVHEQTAGLHGR